MSNNARDAHADARNEIARMARYEAVIRRRTSARVRAQFSRHPDEPGSRSTVYRDGLAPYGTQDFTGFSDGLF